MAGTRFLTNGIRAPNLGGPMPETMHAAAMESDWEKRMKRIWRTLKENTKLLKRRQHRLRRLPVWEADEAGWWRRRRRSSMEDWAPDVCACFESMQVEEEENEDSEEGEDLTDSEQDEVGEVVADHHL